jgi:hypothetical protein
MAINQTISIGRGEDITLNFTMTPRVDITGWNIQFTITNEYNQAAKVLQVAGIAISAPLGRFSVTLSNIQTEVIAPNIYTYDVWRIDSGNERILSIGQFIVTPNARIP